MSPAIVQFLLTVFGLTATWWGLGNNPRLRRLAPIVGLIGQCFWVLFTLNAQRAGVDVRGLWVVVSAFSLVYARGIWLHWGSA